MSAYDLPPDWARVIYPKGEGEKSEVEVEFAMASERSADALRAFRLSRPSFVERTKLTAVWMTQMASGSAVAALVTPIANLALGNGTYSGWVLVFAVVCFLLSLGLHLLARQTLKKLDP